MESVVFFEGARRGPYKSATATDAVALGLAISYSEMITNYPCHYYVASFNDTVMTLI